MIPNRFVRLFAWTDSGLRTAMDGDFVLSSEESQAVGVCLEAGRLQVGLLC